MPQIVKHKAETDLQEFFRGLWKTGYRYCLKHPKTSVKQLIHMLRAWADTLEAEVQNLNEKHGSS